MSRSQTPADVPNSCSRSRLTFSPRIRRVYLSACLGLQSCQPFFVPPTSSEAATSGFQNRVSGRKKRKRETTQRSRAEKKKASGQICPVHRAPEEPRTRRKGCARAISDRETSPRTSSAAAAAAAASYSAPPSDFPSPSLFGLQRCLRLRVAIQTRVCVALENVCPTLSV